jgi:hypothetical protein
MSPTVSCPRRHEPRNRMKKQLSRLRRDSTASSICPESYKLSSVQREKETLIWVGLDWIGLDCWRLSDSMRTGLPNRPCEQRATWTSGDNSRSILVHNLEWAMKELSSGSSVFHGTVGNGTNCSVLCRVDFE